MLDGLFILLGLVLLTVGGDTLIRGSLAIAQRFNISPLLCGLLIVGFGTSAPELVVSVGAAFNNQDDIAIGNVVGSNIGNILLILGMCAVITPLTISPLALKRDATVMLLSSFIFILLTFNGSILGIEGGLLLLMLFSYIVATYYTEKSSHTLNSQMHVDEGLEISTLPSTIWLTIGLMVIGLLGLVAGSKILLIGATNLASMWGVSESIIGLTIIAIGTSLPEFSVSLIAAFRKHGDVAVGNILGSNIFNMFGILGVSAVLSPLGVNQRVIEFDQWVLLIASILLLVFLYTGRKIGRIEGGVLLLGYIGYITANLMM